MKYRTLAGTDLQVSEIGFGVWSISTNWWGEVSEEDGIDLMRHALDLGVNFFDTGDAYGAGYGEEILKKGFPKDRDKIIIGTKFGYDLEAPREPGTHKERPQRWEPEFVRKACESSLRRLGTDVIDFYQLHNPRLTAIQRDDTFAELESLIEAGKVRHYGVAVGPDLGWMAEGEFAIKKRHAPSQIIYNILERRSRGRRVGGSEGLLRDHSPVVDPAPRILVSTPQIQSRRLRRQPRPRRHSLPRYRPAGLLE